MEALLTHEIVLYPLALLLATALGVLSALIRQQAAKHGLEIQEKNLTIMTTALSEGIRFAAHEHKDLPEGTTQEKAIKHQKLHESAIDHAREQTGKVARKFARKQLDRMLKAGLALAKSRI